MKLLDKGELVNALGGKLTAWTIGELTRRGTIPCIKIPGFRRYLYNLEAVEAWLESLQNQQGFSNIKAVR